MANQNTADAVDALRAAVPVSYLSAVIGGWDVNQWAAFFALVYSVYLLVEKVWDRFIAPRLKRRRQRLRAQRQRRLYRDAPGG